MNIEQKIKDAIRDVADFPQEGVVFKDVTPLLADPVLSNEIVDEMIRKTAHLKIDAVVAIESRGFLYGFLLANKLNVPFIPVRKKGKLPGETVEFSYDLEYGSATVEIHSMDIKRVLYPCCVSLRLLIHIQDHRKIPQFRLVIFPFCVQE